MQRQISAMRKLIFDVGPRACRLAEKVAILAGGLACGCVSGHAFALGTDDGAQLVPRHASSSRGTAIFPPEILAASQWSAYDAVMKLRPGFFANNRLAGSGRDPVRPSVILDKGQIEALDILRSVSVNAVREIEFIEPDDARVRYGSAYSAGIIVVRLAALFP